MAESWMVDGRARKPMTDDWFEKGKWKKVAAAFSTTDFTDQKALNHHVSGHPIGDCHTIPNSYMIREIRGFYFPFQHQNPRCAGCGFGSKS